MTKIMIVDDDRTTVSLLQTLLELDGYEVVIVSRGMDVLPKAEQTQPDIFMIDFHLTDVEGVEVIRDLRKHDQFATVPIVMASGMDVSKEAIEAGANEFIVKPFEPSDLPDLFNRLLNS